MLHLLYVVAFTILALLAVSNLIRSLMTLGMESQRAYAPPSQSYRSSRLQSAASHPELLDHSGNLINEPYLVMRSISVDDAREQLDALYNASPSPADQSQEDA
ncbi:MAG: DUF2973 domain-containing protein [Cyanobacteria bacterium J069]|nr:MAG: DUF2973 domain-containing protein [Cyanobacteria bacterium J069]